MSSSTSSSDPWRRFFRLIAGSAAIAAGLVYAFVVLVDPFDLLPLSPPLHRVPVASNQRFSFPTLARSQKFDSVVIGTSSSRLLRPEVLNPLFDARFANLSMNAATVYEQMQLYGVFTRAHPNPKAVILGMDFPWCVTGPDYDRLTFRSFPPWMYQDNLWVGYREMFNLYAVQSAGQLFGVLIGVKKPDQGLDGFTSFVPPDDQYDRARAQLHLNAARPMVPPGLRSGAPDTWTFPTMVALRTFLTSVPATTRKLLYLVPYSRYALTQPGSPEQTVWDECRRHIVETAKEVPNTQVLDFMFLSPITSDDDHYWDGLHYRIGIADQLARDFAAAARGETSADYRILWPN